MNKSNGELSDCRCPTIPTNIRDLGIIQNGRQTGYAKWHSVRVMRVELMSADIITLRANKYQRSSIAHHMSSSDGSCCYSNGHLSTLEIRTV